MTDSAAFDQRLSVNVNLLRYSCPTLAVREGPVLEAELTTLKLIVGPGDRGEPVMTILLSNED